MEEQQKPESKIRCFIDGTEINRLEGFDQSILDREDWFFEFLRWMKSNTSPSEIHIVLDSEARLAEVWVGPMPVGRRALVPKGRLRSFAKKKEVTRP